MHVREERKVVSVLFVDLVGFTSHSDRADPEDVRDLLATYHAHVKTQIEACGGRMEKFIGDAVMAVFGAPLSHTDDAERAVRAGSKALEAVRELNERQPGPELSARAAVNTGEALVAIGSGHERGAALALGDVVNVASRLQSSAPPGRLVVGEETYRATRDTIRYEELEPVLVKGKTEALPLWLVVDAARAPGDRLLRATPLVGRNREISLLRSVWERATTEQRPHLVTLVGPPGIGKSRLSWEFARLVEQTGGRVIRGRCLSYDTQDVYAASSQQVKGMARIFEQDAPDAARTKLDEMTHGVVPEAERQDIVRSLSLLLGLGLDPPASNQLFLLFSARRLVECLGKQQPTLFVFEDIHWADAAQLDLIEYLAAHARETRVVFLALARPELFDVRSTWGSGLHAQSTIVLDPVSESEAIDIVASLLGEHAPSHHAERLVQIAEGNPLFLEELSAALLEGTDRGQALPTTVRAAIAGRVDALPPEHRAALLAASVVGRTFWLGALRALGQTQEIDQVLDALEARDLVRRLPTSRVHGDIEFSFKHVLIRDVCYATLPRGERRNAHASVARYIEEVSGEHDRDLAWLLAHHWEQAGESARAVEYLLLAADRASEAMAQDDAMSMFDRAHGLATDQPTRTRIRLLQALTRVSFENFDMARVELEALLPALEGRDLLEALLGLSRSCHWTERTTEILEYSQRALEIAQHLNATEFVGPAMARLSQAHAMRGEKGDLDRALQLGESALQVWVSGTRAHDLAEHQHLLADQHYWTGGYGRALELSRASARHAVDPHSVEVLLRGGGMDGLLLATMGRYEEALASFDAVIALGRQMGRQVSVLLNYSTLAFREIYDLPEARRRSEEALTQTGRSSSFHMPWMNAAVDLVHCDVLAGEIGAAEARCRDIWEDILATSAWERWLLGGRLAALRADMALQAHDEAAAAEWAQRAVTMSRAVRRRKYEAVARGLLGRALVALGRREDGLHELRAAAQEADDLGNPFGLWRAKADIARALELAGDDTGAEEQFTAAADIIRSVAAGLAPDRASCFMAAPPVAAVLRSL